MATIKVRKYKDSVYIIYSHKLLIFKIFTGVKIEDKYWNIDSPRKNCPDYDNVIARITEMESRVLNASIAVRSHGLDPLVELVRKEYYSQLQPQNRELSFWESYKTYLNLLTCRESTKKKVRITFNVLEYFCKNERYTASADTFNKFVFGRFIQYLLVNQKMADSTIHRHVKALKAFFKFTYPQKDISFMKYSMLATDEEILALTEEELKKLIKANLTGHLDKTRDLFVFCSLTGMRHSDSQAFSPSWVTSEQILEFKQAKTGGKAMPPLYEASRKILTKYNGNLPKISNQKINKYLKELFVKLELNRPVNTHIVRGKVVFSEVKQLSEVISSHAARRTFISLCLQKGMPIVDVAKMSGHGDFRSMKPYIQVTRKHLRDIADKWDI
jgi:site-specific recombinase XerD